jgi:hypothetical protein
MVAHLMRRQAEQAGLNLSVREPLDQLAGVQETVLIYPSTGGRPKARRMLTEANPTQDRFIEISTSIDWHHTLRSYTTTHRNPGLPATTAIKIALARKLGLVEGARGRRDREPVDDDDAEATEPRIRRDHDVTGC